MNYEHSQSTLLPLLFTVALFGFVTVVMVASDEFLLWAFLVTVAIAGLVLMFSRLTVSVGDQVVTASFGIGWPSKAINHSDIEQTEVVRNHWIYGLGIRKIPGGWMYNVWGLDAVELVLASGRKFRIGTDEAEALKTAIDARQDRSVPGRSDP